MERKSKSPGRQRQGSKSAQKARERQSDGSLVAYEGLKAMFSDIGMTPSEYERQVLIAAKRAGV